VKFGRKKHCKDKCKRSNSYVHVHAPL